ncbi:Cytochrome P450 monooxygenase [Pseudocercospora fuligena]|uniref:Cytochrome P450 monooxygenase n=1 Tax=Pseudocercospora fuligena TaxID=685502 RepID=A0A8H6VR24_9PEZI|nr:Cytochrome P450 monooxygenase [Pseudocercospora fuligena]
MASNGEQVKLAIPSGDVAVTVKLINAVNFGPSIISRFMAPPIPGLETFPSNPSHSFLIEHPSGRKLVWDLGIRKDYSNYSPSIASYIPTTKYNINVTKNVSEILVENGIALEGIEAVIWSHWHWDHIGDPSTFPSSTDLVVGPGFKDAMLPGAPANPNSPLLESDYSGRTLREIAFEEGSSTQIGWFPAFDYFGDGSFFLLDSPGHAVGHLCGLARTTTSPESFVLLGGDICHYAGVLRPSKHMSVPPEIRPNPLHPESELPLCPGHAFEQLQSSRARTGSDPLYDPTFGHDIPLAIKTVRKLQELDCDERIFVIIAHDPNVRDLVDHFPKDLNSWKAKDWGAKARWAFLRDLRSYWQQQGID